MIAETRWEENFSQRWQGIHPGLARDRSEIVWLTCQLPIAVTGLLSYNGGYKSA